MGNELNKPLDKTIISQTGFKNVIKSVVNSMFKIQADTKKIYIDLNSCMSILFHYKGINDVEIVKIVSDEIERFLQLYLNDKVEIIILFTLEPSQAHIDIYPDWCKVRYERVAYSKSEFLQNLILSLHRFSEDNPLIKVVNTKKVHPALIVYKNEVNSRNRSTVLSKDVVFQCLPLTNIVVYTGVNYMDLDDPMRNLPDDIELPEPYSLFLPVYLSLRGDSRNEFPGLSGFGPKKSCSYINKNKIRIKTGIESPDHSEKEWIDKYSQLYNINKLLDVNKEEIRLI